MNILEMNTSFAFGIVLYLGQNPLPLFLVLQQASFEMLLWLLNFPEISDFPHLENGENI